MTSEEIRNIPNQKLNEMVTRIVKDAPNHKIDSDGVVLYRMDNSAPGGIDQIFVEDYCGDPALTMPIVFEAGISLIQCDWDEYCAGFVTHDIRGLHVERPFYDANPLRAAVIAYLVSKREL